MRDFCRFVSPGDTPDGDNGRSSFSPSERGTGNTKMSDCAVTVLGITKSNYNVSSKNYLCF